MLNKIRCFIFLLCFVLSILFLFPNSSFAIIGSTTWMFPECPNGTIDNELSLGQPAKFTTEFYLFNPNSGFCSPSCSITFYVYWDGQLVTTYDGGTLNARTTKVISLATILGSPITDKKYAVKIASNGFGFIAHKKVDWFTTNNTYAKDKKYGTHGTIGAKESATTWYFPVGSKKDTVGKGGCQDSNSTLPSYGPRSVGQPLNFRTKFVFYVDNPTSNMSFDFKFFQEGNSPIDANFSPSGSPYRFEYTPPTSLNNLFFSTKITTLTSCVVERIVYWSVEDVFNSNSPHIPLGEGHSEIGYNNTSQTWYLPFTDQGLLDNPVYVTIMNPNTNTDAYVTIKELVHDPKSNLSIGLYECAVGSKTYDYVFPTTDPKIKIPAGTMRRINLARLFTRTNGTQYCSVFNDYNLDSPTVPQFRWSLMKITSNIAVVVESELFGNSAGAEFGLDRNSNYNVNGHNNDPEDYCSILQWDWADTHKAEPNAYKVWYMPFDIGKCNSGDPINCPNHETHFNIAAFDNAASVRIYLINEQGKLIAMRDHEGSGNFIIETSIPASSWIDLFLVGYRETFPSNLESSCRGCYPNLVTSNYGYFGQPVYTSEEKGYIVVESTNSAPLVIGAIQASDDNLYHVPGSKTNCSNTSCWVEHPDDYYTGNPGVNTCSTDSIASYFIRSAGFSGFGTNEEIASPENLPKKDDMPILDVINSNISFSINQNSTSSDVQIIVKDISNAYNKMTSSKIVTVDYAYSDLPSTCSDPNTPPGTGNNQKWLKISGSRRCEGTYEGSNSIPGTTTGNPNEFYFTISADSTGLDPGTYTAVITLKGYTSLTNPDILGSNSPTCIAVTLTVTQSSGGGGGC